MIVEWSIQSRARHCQGCGKAFREKEALHTLLFDERRAYVRLDVCEECWTSQYSQGANHRKGFISHWLGTFLTAPPPPPEPIQKETAETLLRRLVEQREERHVAACFILAVMLERKRLLRVKAQAVEEGRRVFIYEHPRSGDVFTIPDPELRMDQLECVQRDVAHLLEHGLDPAPTPVPADAPAPAELPTTPEAVVVSSPVEATDPARTEAGAGVPAEEPPSTDRSVPEPP